VRVKGGRLLIHSENEGVEMSSVALSNTRFACDVGLLEFQVLADGRVPSLSLARCICWCGWIEFARCCRTRRGGGQREMIDGTLSRHDGRRVCSLSSVVD